MRVRLIPLACPELGVIDVRDELVGIGRDRGDFRRLTPAHVERLSNRHARLYSKNGALFVVDLGSQFGTFVNGQQISDKPVELNHDDEVNFGGELPFRVELAPSGSDQNSEQAVELTLLLEPVDPRKGPAPLKVTNFPFAISKNAPVFAQYATSAAAELDFLSRRHAELSRNDGQILLRDLGSTNGTFLDGQPLSAEPAALRDGQVIAFGGDYFVYRVVLQGLAPLRQSSGGRSKGNAPSAELDKTTFLAAGTSFLDILYTDAGKGPRDGAAHPTEPQAAGAVADVEGGSVRGGRSTTVSTGLERRVPKGVLIAAALAVAVLGTLGYLLTRDSPTERLESLLASGRIDDALHLVRANAESLSGTTAFDRLSLRAIVAKTLRPWLDAYQARDLGAMQALLSAGREAVPNQPGNLDYLETLALIGHVQETVTKRGGAAAPLRVFDPDSAVVREIVDAWSKPLPDKRKVTQRLLSVIPPSDTELMTRYREAYQKASSDILALESQLSVYEPAVEQLQRTMTQRLDKGALDELETDLKDYAERYSQFRGFDELQGDLAKYRKLVEASSQQRVIDAVELTRTTHFHSAAFSAAAERLMRDRLPEQAFLDSYAAAVSAWQRGKVEQAIKQLESLTTGPSGQIAQREIERMQRIVDQVNALQTLEPSETYDDHLLSLYRSLDTNRDQYIQTLLRAEYEDSRKAVERRASKLAASASTAWANYRERGGITSTQRLRSGVGEDYRERAGGLTKAATAARAARRLYEQAQTEPPQEQRSTLTQIEREVALQHQALDELVGVVAESTLRGKRAVLPEREK